MAEDEIDIKFEGVGDTDRKLIGGFNTIGGDDEEGGIAHRDGSSQNVNEGGAGSIQKEGSGSI